MDELQILTDLYNLQLKSGRIYNGTPIPLWKVKLVEECGIEKNTHTVGIVYPDEKEKEKLIKYFSDYTAEITDYISAAEIYKKGYMRNGDNGELLNEDLVSLGLYQLKRIEKAVQEISRGELSHDAEMLLSLVGKQKITESWLDSDHFIDFLEEHGDRFSWFNSDDFLGFADEYAHVKSIVDSYINGRVIKADLEWLDENIKKSYMSLLTTNLKTGKQYSLWAEEVEEDDGISLKEWKISLEGLWSDAESYGICLGFVIYDIYMGLIDMLEDEIDIRRCAFEGGKDKTRSPACLNIFIYNKKQQLYCSKTCYNKARRARRYLLYKK